MICPKCGATVQDGFPSCYNCGVFFSQQPQTPQYQQPSQQPPQYHQPIQPQPQYSQTDQQPIIGQITKAYVTSTSEYFKIFFSPTDILVVNYGGLRGFHLDRLIYSAYQMHKGREKIDQCITKGELKRNFPYATELSKNNIIQIRLKKQLTDAVIEIELPPTTGFLGRQKKDVKKYGFSKKEYDEVKYILSNYYGDRFIEK